MSEQREGTFKMRFVGWKDDRTLMPMAPGSYKRDEIRSKAFRHSLYPWWELVEPVPEVMVPPPRKEDSVFDEEAAKLAWVGDYEDPSGEGPAPIGSLSKKELIEYIESVGGEAKMSMRKDDLVKRASEKGYPSI